MEIMVIFAMGWVMSHAFGEKRDEYEHAQDAHREKYMRRLADKHPSWSKARQARYLQNATRRNAAGHLAYLLRHGWSSTFNDFVHGWDKAKAAHEEWKAEHPKGEKKPGWWATLKAGWGTQKKTRDAEKAKKAETQTPPEPPTPPTGGIPDPRPVPEPEKTPDHDLWPGDEDAKVLPWQPRNRTNPNPKQTPGDKAGSTNGSTTMEYNLDASKAAISEIGNYTNSKISMIEQIIADAIAGDMNKDPESMSHLANLQEALSNVTAHANAFVDGLNKHSGGQEYANTGHAASTSYLQSS